MTATFTVLASGSSGNAAIVRSGDFGLLIDLGLGPRTLARRLAQVCLSWNDVDAVVLTHTHGDHWRETSLAQLHARGRPIFCHESHRRYLDASSRAFGELLRENRVQTFQVGEPFSPGGGLRLLPLELEHDSHRTFGFRLEHETGAWAAGYVADLGGFDDALAEALVDLELLALEFNHDEAMQRASGRPPDLIDRILGPHGHLSNRQAAAMLLQILKDSTNERPRSIVPLHLSRQCNRTDRALNAVNETLSAIGHIADVIIAAPDRAGPSLKLGRKAASSQPSSAGGTLFDGHEPSDVE